MESLFGMTRSEQRRQDCHLRNKDAVVAMIDAYSDYFLNTSGKNFHTFLFDFITLKNIYIHYLIYCIQMSLYLKIKKAI